MGSRSKATPASSHADCWTSLPAAPRSSSAPLPYGGSTHGQIRKHPDRVEKLHTYYSRNPANLADLAAQPARPGQDSFERAFAEILAGCRRLLAPTGRLALTLRPYRVQSALVDLPGQTIKLTAAGCRLVSDPPVRFRRPRGLLALPQPVPGGRLEELRRFVNMTDADWPLIAAWLVAALRPRGPFLLLALHGEQGSAKSTTARVLRLLVDPNAAPLRAEPRQEHDLMIAARNGWLVARDNLSHLAPWLSDALCGLATGGGFAARELYTDSYEVLFDAPRPLLLTGIAKLATRGDLLDRSLVLTLPRIPDEQRRPEETFWPAFEQARPALLGALLDALATGLRRLPEVQLQREEAAKPLAQESRS